MRYKHSKAAGLVVPNLRRSSPSHGAVRTLQVLRQAERSASNSDLLRTSPGRNRQAGMDTDTYEPPESVDTFILRLTLNIGKLALPKSA